LEPGAADGLAASLAAEGRRHTAALAEMAVTSAKTGAGIAALQSQLAALAH
jgi:hypothetical protein